MRVMIEIMHAVRIFSSILSSSGAEEIVENMFTAVMVRYLIRLPREERSEGAIKSNNGYYQLAPSYPVGRFRMFVPPNSGGSNKLLPAG